MTPADLRQALPRFENFVQRFAPLLGDDSRPARAQAYLRGLLLDNDDNKTAEAIALKVHGQPSQVRMTQVFVSQSPWPDEPLRQELTRWVDQELGSDDGILIVDEGTDDTRGWGQRPAVEDPRAGRKGRPTTKARVRPGEPEPQTAETLAAALPATAWQRRKFREGSKGEQVAHFARVRFVVERA